MEEALLIQLTRCDADIYDEQHRHPQAASAVGDPHQEEKLRHPQAASAVGDPHRKRQHLLSSTIKLDWDRFSYLSRFNQVDLLVLDQLRRHAPAQIANFASKDKLQSLDQQIEKGILRRKWMLQIAAACEANNIELILLKGALFGETLYPTAIYKKMNDVDVLVRPRGGKRFCTILQDLGFASLCPPAETSASHHLPPFLSPDGTCLVSPHWGLCASTSPWKPERKELWQRKKSLTLSNGATCFQLSAEDNLLHLCLHLPFYKTGLRELADVYNLWAKNREAFDWQAFLTRAALWRVQDPCYRVLAFTEGLYGSFSPPFVLQELARHASPLTRLDTRTRLSHSLLTTRSVHIAKVERAFAQFKLTSNKWDKLHFLALQWQHTLHANLAERERLVPFSWLPDPLKRAAVPVLLWRAMARDHGHLSLLQLTWDNLKEGGACLLQTESTSRNPQQDRFRQLVSQLE